MWKQIVQAAEGWHAVYAGEDIDGKARGEYKTIVLWALSDEDEGVAGLILPRLAPADLEPGFDGYCNCISPMMHILGRG